MKNDNAVSHAYIELDHKELPDGQTIEHELADKPGLSVIIGRRGEHVFAYLNVCPHAARPMNYAPGKFLFTPDGHLVCPVHGATFELDQGVCLAGPCPGARLTGIPVEQQEDRLRIGPLDQSSELFFG